MSFSSETETPRSPSKIGFRAAANMAKAIGSKSIFDFVDGGGFGKRKQKSAAQIKQLEELLTSQGFDAKEVARGKSPIASRAATPEVPKFVGHQELLTKSELANINQRVQETLTDFEAYSSKLQFDLGDHVTGAEGMKTAKSYIVGYEDNMEEKFSLLNSVHGWMTREGKAQKRVQGGGIRFKPCQQAQEEGEQDFVVDNVNHDPEYEEWMQGITNMLADWQQESQRMQLLYAEIIDTYQTALEGKLRQKDDSADKVARLTAQVATVTKLQEKAAAKLNVAMSQLGKAEQKAKVQEQKAKSALQQKEQLTKQLKEAEENSKRTKQFLEYSESMVHNLRTQLESIKGENQELQQKNEQMAVPPPPVVSPPQEEPPKPESLLPTLQYPPMTPPKEPEPEPEPEPEMENWPPRPPSGVYSSSSEEEPPPEEESESEVVAPEVPDLLAEFAKKKAEIYDERSGAKTHERVTTPEEATVQEGEKILEKMRNKKAPKSKPSPKVKPKALPKQEEKDTAKEEVVGAEEEEEVVVAEEEEAEVVAEEVEVVELEPEPEPAPEPEETAAVEPPSRRKEIVVVHQPVQRDVEEKGVLTDPWQPVADTSGLEKLLAQKGKEGGKDGKIMKEMLKQVQELQAQLEQSRLDGEKRIAAAEAEILSRGTSPIVQSRPVSSLKPPMTPPASPPPAVVKYVETDDPKAREALDQYKQQAEEWERLRVEWEDAYNALSADASEKTQKIEAQEGELRKAKKALKKLMKKLKETERECESYKKAKSPKAPKKVPKKAKPVSSSSSSEIEAPPPPPQPEEEERPTTTATTSFSVTDPAVAEQMEEVMATYSSIHKELRSIARRFGDASPDVTAFERPKVKKTDRKSQLALLREHVTGSDKIPDEGLGESSKEADILRQMNSLFRDDKAIIQKLFSELEKSEQAKEEVPAGIISADSVQVSKKVADAVNDMEVDELRDLLGKAVTKLKATKQELKDMRAEMDILIREMAKSAQSSDQLRHTAYSAMEEDALLRRESTSAQLGSMTLTMELRRIQDEIKKYPKDHPTHRSLKHLKDKKQSKLSDLNQRVSSIKESRRRIAHSSMRKLLPMVMQHSTSEEGLHLIINNRVMGGEIDYESAARMQEIMDLQRQFAIRTAGGLKGPLPFLQYSAFHFPRLIHLTRGGPSPEPIVQNHEQPIEWLQFPKEARTAGRSPFKDSRYKAASPLKKKPLPPVRPKTSDPISFSKKVRGKRAPTTSTHSYTPPP